MKNILMISWYNFDRKFWWTQRCLWIFNNLQWEKYLLSYNKQKNNINNFFYVHTILWNFSKYFQMLVYFSPINIYRVFKILKNKKINIVFAESIWTLLPIILFKKIFKYQIVFDTHNFEYEYYKQKNSKLTYIIFYIEKYSCIFSDKILVCSEREKSLFIKEYKLNSNKIIILENWMNPPIIQKESHILKKSLNIWDDVIVLSFVWKLDYLPNKEAVNFLIQNIEKINWNIILLIIWGWLEQITLSKKILQIWYTDNVYDYINISDICLSPIFKWSWTRLKILEYIALNKTIVSTKKWHEWIPINQVSWLYSSNDINFIDKINFIIENRLYNKKLDNSCFIQKYLWSNLINDFQKMNL